MVLAIPTVLLLTALFLCGILHIVDAAKNISHIDVRKAPLKNSKELQIYPAVGGADTFDVALMQPVLNLDREDSVEGLPAENLGRLVQGPVDLVSVARLLRYHYANGFCRGFCPGYTTPYIKKTRFKSTTKFVKTVTTSCMGGCELQTTTTTVTENAPPDVTVTETTTASATITTTLAAQTQTITTTETAQVTTTQTITTTETVTAGPTLTLKRRAQVFYAPEWLNGVPTDMICPACKIVWPPPAPKIITVYRTTTVYNTKTKIVSSDAPTTTATEIVTPPEGVITETQTTTLVYTESETSTPLTTTTSTELLTVTQTETATETTTVTNKGHALVSTAWRYAWLYFFVICLLI